MTAKHQADKCAQTGTEVPTFLFHAHTEALVEAAALTGVAGELGDDAVASVLAVVLQVLLHSALEEALAALAGEHRVVIARGTVATHQTRRQRPING